jgi:hypothetical protein
MKVFLFTFIRWYNDTFRPRILSNLPPTAVSVLRKTKFILRESTLFVIRRSLPTSIKEAIKEKIAYFKRDRRIRLCERAMMNGFSDFASKELEDIMPSLNGANKTVGSFLLSEYYYTRGNSQKSKSLLEDIRANDADLIKNYKLSLRYVNLLQKHKLIDQSRTALNKLRNFYFSSLELTLLNSNLLSLQMNRDKSHSLDALNKILAKKKLAKILLKNAIHPTSLDNICCAPATKVNNHHKVSVLMPAFNCAKTIGYAIESVLDQTWQNLELIIVDDASRDNTVEIVEEFAKKDARVKLYKNSKNIGAYGCRNFALEKSTGDLITVHDSDDWSHSQKIEIQINHFLKKISLYPI